MHPDKQSEREANDLKKAMLLLAMLAMVLAAVAPAYAQQGVQLAAGGDGDDLIQQCQNNLNQTIIDDSTVTGDQGNANININTGDLVNNCTQVVNNINNTNIVDKDVTKVVGFTDFEGVKKVVFFDEAEKFFFIVIDKEIIVVEKNVIVFTVDFEKVVTHEDKVVTATKTITTPTTTTTVSPEKAVVLPATGGASVIALGAGALLVAGGLLARRIVR